MMLVDCTTCPVRDVHCADCMVTALGALDAATGVVPQTTTRLSLTPRVVTGLESGSPPHAESSVLPLDRAERRAVSMLLGAGLVSVGAANAARAVPTPAHAAAASASAGAPTAPTVSTRDRSRAAG